jgi:hypothetical protein
MPEVFMKKYQVLTVLFAVALAACNGGGGRKSLGSQCPSGDYKPVRSEIGTNQQKVDLKSDDFTQIPPGVYDYTGATVYYLDKSDLRLQLEDVKQKDGSFMANWGCIRNSSNKLSGAINVESITKMVVSADHKMTIDEVREYRLFAKDGKFEKTSSKSQKTVGSPKETMSDKTKDLFFVMTNQNPYDFEVRAFGGDENGQFAIAARFKRTDNPK